MKAIYLLTILATLFSVPSFSIVTIFDTAQDKEIELKEMIQNIPDRGQVVLGEYHYQDLILKAEGEIIRQIVKEKNLENNFSVCWEFLDYPNQPYIENWFDQFATDLLDLDSFFKLLFPNDSNGINHAYRYFFEAAKDLGGKIVATNAPRVWKSIITKKGIDALDPNLIPPHYEIGSTQYFKRFKNVMGNHVPSHLLQNYFQAQSYTDSVMAYSIQNLAHHDLKFLIVGAFHSDYNDGVVREINKIMPDPTITIKIIDISKMTEEEVNALKLGHPEYGPLARFLYLVDGKK